MKRQIEVFVEYFKHAARSHSKYDLHSPFVYDFYKNIMLNGQSNQHYRLVNKYRKELVSQSRFIKRKDLGSRAKDYPCDQRFARVKDIARRSSVSVKYGELLFRVTQKYKPANILELGTSLGISTMYFALASPESHIYTMEGCLDSAHVAKASFDHYGLKNVTLVTGNFEDKLDSVLQEMPSVDLVFFDGNHKKVPTLSYFEKCLQHIHPDTVFIFDDIHWSSEMKEAWDTICKDPRIKVTIDLFQLGIVFFKEELSRENFRIHF